MSKLKMLKDLKFDDIEWECSNCDGMNEGINPFCRFCDTEDYEKYEEREELKQELKKEILEELKKELKK